MSRRIAAKFAALKAEGRAGLVTFTMACDPDLAAAQSVLNALPEAGADIVELGMPFSDPMADGKTIQAAGIRALQAQAAMADIFSIIRNFRTRDPHTPLILMGYYNPVFRYGPERFAGDAAAAGADGVIIVDLPPEEEGELTPHLKAHGMAMIRLIAPTSTDERLPVLLKEAEGFVYYVSVTGITGAKAADPSFIAEEMKRLRAHTTLPIAVGFGVKTPEQARAIAQHSDAVVVGSALVEALHAEGEKAALSLVQKLAFR